MKINKLLLSAIVSCTAVAIPASAGIMSAVNICEVDANGNVLTVRTTTMGSANYILYFKNVGTQQTFALHGVGLTSTRKYAVNPGTYTLKYSEPVGGNPPQAIYPNAIVVKPYSLTIGQGTGCTLNVPLKIGDKAVLVPTTPLPQ